MSKKKKWSAVYEDQAEEHQSVSPAAVYFLLQMVELSDSQFHFSCLFQTLVIWIGHIKSKQQSQYCLVAAFLFHCGIQF